MKYRWLDCPGCLCHLAINTTETPQGISGSLRRWSSDRGTNDGKPLRIAASERSAGGGFVTTCVCGQTIVVPAEPDAVSAEREGNLRVTLGD
jgi:hypothetical protein